MKKTLYALIILFPLGFLTAQTCSPLQTWADTVEFGAFPDTIVNFPVAQVDEFYSTDLNFKVPDEVTPQLDPSGVAVGSEIESFVVTSVEGMPDGIEFNCNSTNCYYEGGDNGCANIYGTPTTPGEYDIVINIKATILLALIPGLPPTPVDQDTQFTGYKIIVDGELNTSVYQLDETHVYPNPFTNQFTVSNPKNRDLTVALFDLSGKLLSTTKVSTTKQELNTSHLPKGMYVVHLSDVDEVKQFKLIKQ